ncbi:hypothetical protein [Salininema proteolyticum]|uniref:Lipoprotein n=1 Tax=Salininema proteolyticum TaxID=1607685 RepID=A0ABV8U070_9ACTN
MRRRTIKLPGAILALIVLVLAASCTEGADESPMPGRPVSAEEASLLALARYKAWTDSPVSIELRVPDGTTVEAVVDYKERKAVGSFTDGAGRHGMVVWTDQVVAFAEGAVPEQIDPGAGSLPGEWTRRPMGKELFDRAAGLALGLGDDRPDNAQLIISGGARRLRTETVDGVACDVYSGPRPSDADDSEISPLSYWISEEGRMKKAEMEFKGLNTPAVVSFPEDA